MAGAAIVSIVDFMVLLIGNLSGGKMSVGKQAVIGTEKSSRMQVAAADSLQDILQ